MLRGARRARAGLVRHCDGVIRFHPYFMPIRPRAMKSLNHTIVFTICAAAARLAREMSRLRIDHENDCGARRLNEVFHMRFVAVDHARWVITALA